MSVHLLNNVGQQLSSIFIEHATYFKYSKYYVEHFARVDFTTEFLFLHYQFNQTGLVLIGFGLGHTVLWSHQQACTETIELGRIVYPHLCSVHVML